MKTPEDFENALDLYGSDLIRWPVELSDRAQALLSSSALARRMLENARVLDDALNGYIIAPPDAAFEARLLDLAPASDKPLPQSRKRLLAAINLRLFTAMATGLACAAFGFVISVQSIDAMQTDAEAEAFMTASTRSLSGEFWQGDEG